MAFNVGYGYALQGKAEIPQIEQLYSQEQQRNEAEKHRKALEDAKRQEDLNSTIKGIDFGKQHDPLVHNDVEDLRKSFYTDLDKVVTENPLTYDYKAKQLASQYNSKLNNIMEHSDLIKKARNKDSKLVVRPEFEPLMEAINNDSPLDYKNVTSNYTRTPRNIFYTPTDVNAVAKDLVENSRFSEPKYKPAIGSNNNRQLAVYNVDTALLRKRSDSYFNMNTPESEAVRLNFKNDPSAFYQYILPFATPKVVDQVIPKGNNTYIDNGGLAKGEVPYSYNDNLNQIVSNVYKNTAPLTNYKNSQQALAQPDNIKAINENSAFYTFKNKYGLFQTIPNPTKEQKIQAIKEEVDGTKGLRYTNKLNNHIVGKIIDSYGDELNQRVLNTFIDTKNKTINFVVNSDPTRATQPNYKQFIGSKIINEVDAKGNVKLNDKGNPIRKIVTFIQPVEIITEDLTSPNAYTTLNDIYIKHNTLSDGQDKFRRSNEKNFKPNFNNGKVNAFDVIGFPQNNSNQKVRKEFK